MVTAILTCWIKVPFEIGYKAYQADTKFPKELRRNYRGPFSAMASLFYRNPMNLFRNGYPAMVASTMETFFAFYLYDELKDFSWFFIKDGDFWRGALKTFNAAFAAFVGASFSFVHDHYLRNMVEKR